MRQVTPETISAMALQAKGQIDKIFLHWSAGHHFQYFPDYHINIDGNGGIHISTDDLTEVLAHTWRRNTGAVGIALACCYKATSDDLGPESPTRDQINSMALVIRLLCDGLELPIDAEHVMTHAEVATIDGYGPGSGDPQTRWDLAILRNGDEWMSGGDEMRRMAQA